jgi:alpha-pyrone synthase
MRRNQADIVTIAYINRIATAVPEHDLHKIFVSYARSLLKDPRKERMFDKMVEKSQISHRWSGQAPGADGESTILNGKTFYSRGAFPSTATRMRAYEQLALPLAVKTVAKLSLGDAIKDVTHVVITSCTGLAAPGLDLQLIEHFGISTSAERTIVGFMGCYAAINGLKLAHHIVRSEPTAKVLMLSLELSTLHFQEIDDLEQILMFLLFADGAAAAYVTAAPEGLAIKSFHSEVIPGTADLMSWHIRDQGFDMVLSGDVPRNVCRAMTAAGPRVLRGAKPTDIAMWAVHPGGRTVLDAVEAAFVLPKDQLRHSRAVLNDYGNMSSATVLFVLQKFMNDRRRGQQGCAMSFGPGLTAETMLFATAE